MSRNELVVSAELKDGDSQVNVTDRSLKRYSAGNRHWRHVFLWSFLIVVAGVSRSGSCQEAHFEQTPAWTSGPANVTWSVALGDVDGDGDLDLVCGNYNQSITLYKNVGGTFEVTPSWSSAEVSTTYGVALGDVDGDGDLDLVCGNDNQSTTLYLNTGTIFEETPAWYSEPARTQSVALGDVDGDGDLDLVCGNGTQSNTLYKNIGGTFESTPAWSSSRADRTISVALGDVDGDGDLDLVCANGSLVSTLYKNIGGTFESTPSFSWGAGNDTNDIVLGDVDGDGDLDVVCGNEDKPKLLYLNTGGIFEETPAWSAGATEYTQSVTLGDVDSDGDLDLICGNADEEVSTLYLNVGGTFEATPAWSSGQGGWTMSTALGDVDGDGDLDLVCGNDVTSSALFRNMAATFTKTPVWSSGFAATTWSVALGDIDSDGDLDLVCGNENQSTILYKNGGSAFEATPSWSSGSADATRSITLGDVDGDGDLDLVCGNFNQPTVLYLNTGTTFEAIPAWSSELASATWSVALGDVDGDGDLDLVCGNYDQSTTLYKNVGGTFEAAPSWSSGIAAWTYGVALGDIDGDGDLDLVCGNSHFQGSALYRNVGGTFETMPAWTSSTMSATRSVALGDVDGDGDLDLVCGNSDEPDMLFLNTGGIFESTPVWSSSHHYSTWSVALEDVDGDGDLDLLCGNYSDIQPTVLYRNVAGVFELTPIWSSEQVTFTRSIVLGDIDDDGDFDLICGNENQPSTLYRNISRPEFKMDPLAPTHILTNNSAYLSSVRFEDVSNNLRCIRFTGIDVESDPLWLLPEYQYRGAPTWYPVEAEGQAGKMGPFASSPAGILDSLEWDISRMPFDPRDVVLRLRAIEIPKRVSIIRHVASFMKDVGPVLPRRPEISLSTNALSFATPVTVGDTISAALTIANVGNETLHVADIELPSTEMRLDRPTPFNIVAGNRDTLRLFLEPRTEYVVSGDLRIVSNDALTPVLSIGVSADIRPLRFKSRLLATAPELPLGEAVTVVVTPLLDVRVERGYLYLRSERRASTFQDSIPLSKYEDNYIAVIPGSAVTEAGLEYYIKVENSGIFATDPPGAPADSVFSRAVSSPQLITAVAQPNSGADFLGERDVKVQASLPTGAEFVQGTLHYRQGGETAYQTSSFQAGDPLPFSIIPDSLVGPRGLEYWVEVQTLTAHLTDPPRVPEASPHSIRVSIPNLLEEKMYPEKAYRMVSIPIDFGSEFTGTLEALLSDQGAFGPYDPTQWRSFRYLPASKGYRELSAKEKESFKPIPGRAFWLISASKNRIGTGPVKGLSTATDSTYSIVLEPGWNMIGDPFDFPVVWDSMLVDGMKMMEAESVAVEPPVAYVIGKGYRLGAEILEPFGGYWVKNLSDNNVMLQIPPKGAPVAVMLSDSTAAAALASPAGGEDSWRLELRASSCGAVDCGNVVGVATGASSVWDKHDRSEPPLAPERALSLYFPHDTWKQHEGSYAVDIRGAYEPLPTAERALLQSSGAVDLARAGEDLWGHIWRFDVAKNFTAEGVGDEVTLDLGGIEGVPAEASIYLIDRELGELVDVRSKGGYTYHLGERPAVSEAEARFLLIVGSKEFMDESKDELPEPPKRTALYQNYPNPFNPSTIVRYDLAHASSVRLTVYDATGALVKVLYDGRREPGRYEEAWDGRNESGRRVSTGIYFSRLETGGGHRQTMKMLLIR